ncbi:MAG TPA: 30S ribosome-binding factor RbfA [Alphaproteobacteria bacterium]|nr:30S ribosome-binding factor RbfA [Alphaproteobacteria bacterium]
MTMKRRKHASPRGNLRGPQTEGRSQRQLRVGEAIRHALVRILERAHFHDPDLLDVSVTVTEVRVSPDLRSATAFVVPLAGANQETVIAALRRAVPYLRGQLAHEVDLRYVPQLSLEPDTSFDYARRIDSLLRRADVARDLDPGDEDAADDDRDGKRR